jgi:hypothetical protein
MSLSNFKECLSKQVDGSPCEIDGMTFHVRRANTPEYGKVFVDIKRSLFGPWYQENTLTDNEILKATGHLLAEYLVCGWDNVTDEDGNEVTYSQSNARAIFCNEQYFQSINLIIISHASSYANYLIEKLKKDIDDAKK